MRFDSLKINGVQYKKKQLATLVKDKLNEKGLVDFECSFYTFIKDWISNSDTVSVKTSGSTGKPKTIKVKKAQMIASAQMTCKYFKINSKSNLLLCLSADYIAGKMMIVRAFIGGANLVTVSPDGNPLKPFKDKSDFAAMVPLQVENSLSTSGTKRKFLSIKNVIVGGAAIPYALEKRIEKCSNNIYSTFAMTETLSHIALRRLSGRGISDKYELLPGIRIRKDKRGCMVVDAPVLNDKPIVTNDIIEMVDSRHFKWLGRYDNVINSGGIKIYPEKIEEKLAPYIKNRFFVAALPDDKLGNKVVLILENNEDTEKIKKKAEKLLGKFERPKEYYSIMKFRETTNGKVQRSETLNALFG
jgi:O-succinylbenzoic acid--CoA ligase